MRIEIGTGISADYDEVPIEVSLRVDFRQSESEKSLLDDGRLKILQSDADFFLATQKVQFDEDFRNQLIEDLFSVTGGYNELWYALGDVARQAFLMGIYYERNKKAPHAISFAVDDISPKEDGIPNENAPSK